MKIHHKLLKSVSVLSSKGTVKLDENGHAEVDDAFGAHLLLSGFHLTLEPKEEPKVPVEFGSIPPAETPVEEPVADTLVPLEDAPTEEPVVPAAQAPDTLPVRDEKPAAPTPGPSKKKNKNR